MNHPVPIGTGCVEIALNPGIELPLSVQIPLRSRTADGLSAGIPLRHQGPSAIRNAGRREWVERGRSHRVAACQKAAYGSWLVAGGAPLHAVRDLLGPGDVRTTSIYLATARQDLRDAIEALPKIPGQGRVKRKSTKSNADRNTGGVDGAGL